MIDVLLAACNGEKYLEAQLASLRAQTWRDFRVLLQDDGSTDGTAEILRRAEEDPRFVPGAEQGRHLGAAGNFFSLTRQAKNEWIALCDQDDVWREDRLAACAKAMAEAEARWGRDCPILVHSDLALTDAAGEVTHPSFVGLQGWNPGAVSLAETLVQNNVTGCATLFNRPLALLAEEADSRVPMHDWYLAQCAAACGHIVFVPEALVLYRQHGNNTIGAGGGSAARLKRILGHPSRARARIALTYTQAEALLRAAGERLPESSRETIQRYLALRRLPKWQRLKALRQGGYRMQSPLARAGQLIFG